LSPILGIFASSRAAAGGDYESIATVTVGSGGAASISFTSISSTYTHLQIRCLARTNRASAGDQIRLQLNTDTGANYSDHVLSGDGATAVATGAADNTFMWLGRATGASSASSIFGVSVIDIVDYADVNKYKTLRSLTGTDRNGSGDASVHSGSWRSTSAITSIQVIFIGTLMEQYSTFSLYGIKGS
jgi:hypothetical protein